MKIVTIENEKSSMLVAKAPTALIMFFGMTLGTTPVDWMSYAEAGTGFWESIVSTRILKQCHTRRDAQSL